MLPLFESESPQYNMRTTIRAEGIELTQAMQIVEQDDVSSVGHSLEV